MATTPAGAMAPQDFAATAASSNMFEIESSKLAIERSENPDVRAFAQHMIDDHTAAGEKMKAAAKSDGVTVPDALAPGEQTKLDELKSTEGGDFDHAYVTAQAAAHDDAVALFQAFATEGDQSALGAFAAETLPTLQQHQSAAHKLADSV
jgi:putative membrane protein